MDIADALVQILVARGVRTVYGVPGDYALGLFDRFERCHDIELVCPVGEEGALFAADAQAQLTGGIGVCLVTYGVGALRVMNPIGGAYAEKSRVLVISGAPGMAEREQHPRYLHHVHKTVNTQMRIFREVCTEVGELNSSLTAVFTIRKVLDAMEAQSLPGFLQVPRDQLVVPLPTPLPPLLSRKRLFHELEVVCQRHRALALQVLRWLRTRKNPLVIVGLEIQRFGMQELMKQVLKREGWQWAESVAAKNVLEATSGLVSAYSSIREALDGSDGILMIGLPLSDLEKGLYSLKMDPDKLVEVSMDRGLQWQHGELYPGLTCGELLKIWNEQEEAEGRAALPEDVPDLIMEDANVEDSLVQVVEEPPRKRRSTVKRVVEAIRGTDEQGIDDAVEELLQALGKEQKITNRDDVFMEEPSKQTEQDHADEANPKASFLLGPRTGQPATVRTLTKAIGAIVAKHTNNVVVVDTGDPMFAATELRLSTKANRFLNNGHWASVGFALPAAIGVWYATRKESRPIVLVGDGAFLTSCNELATLVRYRVPAIIIVFDNHGYGTLKPMMNGSFNEVHPVNHVALTKAYGCYWARRVWSEKEVWESLECIFSEENSDRPMVLSVMLDSRDASVPLQNICCELKKRMKES